MQTFQGVCGAREGETFTSLFSAPVLLPILLWCFQQASVSAAGAKELDSKSHLAFRPPT